MAKSKKKSSEEFEISFYEGILKETPNFTEVLSALGDLYTTRGMVDEGLAVDQKLSQLKPQDPIVLYNLACSYSLLKKIDEAFVNIKRAIKFGYDDIGYLQQDSDLSNLREDSRFKKYLSKVQKENPQDNIG